MVYVINIDTGELEVKGDGGGGGTLTSLSSDSGAATPSGGVITIAGGTGIDTSGAGSTITVAVEGDVAQSFPTDAGTGIPVVGALSILGGTGIDTSAVGGVVTITATGGDSATFPTDSGTATPVAGALNVIGGSGIDTSGSGSTVTIAVEADVAQSFPTDAGTAVPSAGALNIIGGSGIDVSGSGSTVTITAEADIPQSFPTDSGTAAPAAGILNILGGSGIDTSGSGSTVTIAVETDVAQSFPTDSGTATPSVGVLSVLGGTGLNSAGAGSTVTVNIDVPVIVAHGGTGLETITNGGVMYGNGTSAVATVGPLTAGQLVVATGGDPFAINGMVPGCVNLSVSYSGGTFTVLGGNGSALSATNPAFVTLQSKGTPGKLVTIAVTANQTFTDGSAGDTDNARFGLTSGVNWSQDIPFFLYGVMDDSEAVIAFMISRNPAANVSPASTSISKAGTIINVNQSDFFCLPNVTITSYDANPTVILAAFRMRFTGATDHWTVQTITTADGIGKFHDNTWFLMVAGQNGAAASTYFFSTVGTEPQFNENNILYSIKKDGYVDYLFRCHDCSVVGVGAQDLQPILPYAGNSTSVQLSYLFRWRDLSLSSDNCQSEIGRAHV